MLGRLFPDHLAAGHVRPLAHGVASAFVAQQAADLARHRARIPERDEHAAAIGEQLLCMPIRRRNHGFAATERIGERARGDLRFVEIRRDVKVRGADELLQIFKFYEPVVEDDVLLEFVFFGKDLEGEPVGFAMLA